MRPSRRFLFCGSFAAFVVASLATTGEAQPDKNLLKRVETLEEELANLTAENATLKNRVSDLENASDPLFLEVHCPGESVMAALEEAEGRTGPVTITIFGECAEEVLITRDDVTLQGAHETDPPQDGLKTESEWGRVIEIDGAVRVNLRYLTITYGDGLNAHSGASFIADTLQIQEAKVAVGVSGAIGNLTNTTIENNNWGVGLNDGATLHIWTSEISNNVGEGVHLINGSTVGLHDDTMVQSNGHHGVFAKLQSLVVISGATIQDNRGDGVALQANSTLHVEIGAISENDGNGVILFNGCVAVFEGGTVANNDHNGIALGGGSSAWLPNFYENLTIQGNAADGIGIGDTSVLMGGFGLPLTITGNHRYGIGCDGPPAVPQLSGTEDVSGIFGNVVGEISPSCPGWPY